MVRRVTFQHFMHNPLFSLALIVSPITLRLITQQGKTGQFGYPMKAGVTL
jgi:hypothetical protein